MMKVGVSDGSKFDFQLIWLPSRSSRAESAPPCRGEEVVEKLRLPAKMATAHHTERGLLAAELGPRKRSSSEQAAKTTLR